MRSGLLLGVALGAVNTAVVVLLDWALRKRSDFGWFAYSPMHGRYADYLPPQHVVTGWAAVAVVAGVLIVLNMAMAAGYVVVRRRARPTE
jgi:hypothetical protein